MWLEHHGNLLHSINGIWMEKRRGDGLGIQKEDKRRKSSRKRDQACCMQAAWGLVADCAFPPFWLWLSLNPGNTAQTERRGSREMGQRWETKRKTETDQNQEAVSEIEKEMKWCSVTSLIEN